MEKRKDLCPNCGYHLLARENDYIICLSNICDWRILSQREADITLPDFSKLRKEYNGK